MSMFLSDCQNVYSSDSEGDMDQASACQNCQSSSMALLQQGYTLGGSCSQAPNVQDGNGYMSDGVNYYVENPMSPIDNPSALMACQNPYNQFQGLQVVGSCSTENFMLFGSNKGMNVLLVLLFLLIIGAIAYYYIIRMRKPKPMAFEFF